MYDYRKMTMQERQKVLQERQARGFPVHSPPHFNDIRGTYLITSACYEHHPIFQTPGELDYLVHEMLKTLTDTAIYPQAWVFLPNHYHFLTEVEDISSLSETRRLVHSRISTHINTLQRKRGRKVWHRYSDRLIRNERHYLATINYLHYNPVKHGVVDETNDWVWSSVHDYTKNLGEQWLAQTWTDVPILDYGKGWDW